MSDPTDAKIEILASDARGPYAWRDLMEMIDPAAWGIQPEDVATLKAGPDDENYWEAANNAEMDAEYTAPDGHTWRLYQDGDIFALRDDLTDEEREERFGW